MKRLFLTFIVLSAAAAQAADPPAAAPAAPTAPPAAGTPAAATPVATPPAATPPAPKRESEAEIAKDLTAHLVVGRAVELPVGDRKVLALYTPHTAPKAMGAVILLHDLGGHADWPGAIAELRRSLPKQGWSTLSVQLPVVENGTLAAQQLAFLDQTSARIDAARAFLQSEGQLNVALIGHGLSAVAALEHTNARAEGVRALVLLGIPHVRGNQPRLSVLEGIAKLPLPTFDLYGGNDRIEVIATATARREAAGHKGNYLQVSIPAADHFFTGQERLFANRVRGWLDRHAAGTEIKNSATTQTQTP